MNQQQLIPLALSKPTTAISYYLSQELAALYFERAIIEGSDCSFNLEAYGKAGLCQIQPLSFLHNQISTGWDGLHKTIYESAENAAFEVLWQGNTLNVWLMTWPERFQKINYYWILATTKEIAQNFFAAVCEWNDEIRAEVLVFEDGYWAKNPRLFQEIKSTTFENLVLRGNLKQELQDDLASFFNSYQTYKTYRVPWKRGILLIGPPGNGKTHAVKALINQMQQPCLYVKSLKSQYGNVHNNIHQVFAKARKSAPCLLVLEDLDSLIDDENRSFFLNEIDGFAANLGIVTIATTNHPERLDPAILERPSRFDRKYHFELPEVEERLAYIKQWNNSLAEVICLSNGSVERISQLTEGFSFAYLKELFVSSIMRWMKTQSPGAMEAIMTKQVEELRKQMNSTISKKDSKE